MTKRVRILLVVVTMGLMFAGSALADWQVGDGHKMHFPQLPDPCGLDVSFQVPYMLADDWRCSETGPVSDIHLWVSHKEDFIPFLMGIHVEIFSNIAVGPLVSYSRPGQSLWQADLFPLGEDFDYASAPGGTGDQGWYDPYTDLYVPSDHKSYYQMNLTNITDPFIQKAGEIYWLGVTVDTSYPGTEVADGWKTSLDSFEDSAVYLLDVNEWGQLLYPSSHPLGGKGIDLAFVITPEPVTLSLLVFGGLAILRGRKANR